MAAEAFGQAAKTALAALKMERGIGLAPHSGIVPRERNN
jgi:hypothetical protein